MTQRDAGQWAGVMDELASMGVPVPDLDDVTIEAIIDTDMASFYPAPAVALLRTSSDATGRNEKSLGGQ